MNAGRKAQLVVGGLTSVAVLIAGLVLLLVPVGATSPGGRDLSCGNGFYSSDLTKVSPDSQATLAAEITRARLDPRYKTLMEGYQAACGDALTDRRIWGFSLLGLGALAGVSVLVVRHQSKRTSVRP